MKKMNKLTSGVGVKRDTLLWRENEVRTLFPINRICIIRLRERTRYHRTLQ